MVLLTVFEPMSLGTRDWLQFLRLCWRAFCVCMILCCCVSTVHCRLIVRSGFGTLKFGRWCCQLVMPGFGGSSQHHTSLLYLLFIVETLFHSPSSLTSQATMPSSGYNSQGNRYNTPGGSNSSSGSSYHCK
jgi:hypothetical protein